MKRKVVFILFLLGTLGLLVGVIRLLQDRTPKQGVLKISSTPDSDIFLDTRHIGRTPYEDKIQEGEYTVKLVPESTIHTLSTWQGKVKVAKNLLTYVNAEPGDSDFTTTVDVLWLEKITAKLSEISVVTIPDGASVTIDGETKGNSPVTAVDIEAGEHTIAVSSNGFVSRSLKVKTTEGYRLIASLKLALSRQPDDATEEASASGEISPTAGPSLRPTVSRKPTPTVRPTVTPKVSATTPTADNVPEKPYVTIKDTPTGFLRVRSEPSTSASESGKVSPGEMFPLLDEQNGWYEITYDSDKSGWISGQYATKTE